MKDCRTCTNICRGFSRTAFGTFVCDPCWNDYLESEKGKVELFLGICSGKYFITDFSEELLNEIIISWRKYRSQLSLFKGELNSIEAMAICIGLL